MSGSRGGCLVPSELPSCELGATSDILWHFISQGAYILLCYLIHTIRLEGRYAGNTAAFFTDEETEVQKVSDLRSPISWKMTELVLEPRDLGRRSLRSGDHFPIFHALPSNHTPWGVSHFRPLRSSVFYLALPISGVHKDDIFWEGSI